MPLNPLYIPGPMTFCLDYYLSLCQPSMQIEVIRIFSNTLFCENPTASLSHRADVYVALTVGTFLKRVLEAGNSVYSRN